MKKPIELPSYGITLTPATITDRIGRELCPHCNEPDCCYSCELSTEAQAFRFDSGPLWVSRSRYTQVRLLPAALRKVGLRV